MGEPVSIRPNSPEIREVKWATRGELPKLFIFPDQWKKAKLVIEELLGN
jgi:hypothetical protein